ncbi:MAG TPA: hypothetical protein VI121_07995, partial [Agromyces sp.]
TGLEREHANRAFVEVRLGIAAGGHRLGAHVPPVMRRIPALQHILGTSGREEAERLRRVQACGTRGIRHTLQCVQEELRR